ncbi:MAG: hypothetical protein WBE61_09155 [Nitrososphaeraceae archaeon]
MSSNRNKSKDKGRDILEDTSKEGGVDIWSATSDITTVEDTHKKTIDTGDIDRASVAKGIRSPDDGYITAADIAKGTTKPEDIISYTTGISAETGKVLNPKAEASTTKDLDRDVTTNTEDASKLVSSGTSSAKSGGIDKADIYSSDDSSRHLEKVQETQTTEKVEDKEATATES